MFILVTKNLYRNMQVFFMFVVRNYSSPGSTLKILLGYFCYILKAENNNREELLRKRPSNNMTTQPNTDTPAQNDNFALGTFLQNKFRPIEQLRSDVVFDTDDIFELCKASDLYFTKTEISNKMVELGFNFLSIPGTVEKIWLIEEAQ